MANEEAWDLLMIAFIILAIGFCVAVVRLTEGTSADELKLEQVKEENYAKCLDVCRIESNETLAKISRAYCVQQCKRN